jgi:hypothetical protein
MATDEQTRAAIRLHAEQIADEAPPLTTAQALLLVSVYARYPLPVSRYGAGSA